MQPDQNWFQSLPADRLLIELSLWSADLGRIAAEMARAEPFADIWHVDVADGHFSPAFLFFPDLVANLRRRTAKPIHVHLMVSDDILVDQVKQFAEAGADLISVHAENATAREALSAIDRLGLLSGVVLKLETPVEAAEPFLDSISMITLLGTQIGVKGCGLDPSAELRLRQARALADSPSRRRIAVAADGGIRESTVPRLRSAGAQTVVMGSLAFSAPDMAARIEWARALP